MADPARWPPVTAVVPTHHRPELLRRAVDAVLAQDYPGAIECIVVFDQAEPDPTLADRPGQRADRALRWTENARTPGLAGARNTGADAARGELLAFCDDDDEWVPGKLRAQVPLLVDDPAVLVATSGIVVVNGDVEIIRLPPAPRVGLDDFLRSRVTAVHSSTLVIRKDAFFGPIGPVDEALPGSYGEDYEWLLRAAAQAPLAAVEAPLVRVRWGATSLFVQRWRTAVEALRYLLDKHPALQHDRRNRARIHGQLAFASAAAGDRRGALRYAARCARANPGEARAYLALGVASGVLNADRVIAALNRRGRGI